jgi:hypothetical protein
MSTGKRPFAPSHLAALREGAKRRHDEQVVGNWIRRCNPVLYAQLLLEASVKRLPVKVVLQEPVQASEVLEAEVKAPIGADRQALLDAAIAPSAVAPKDPNAPRPPPPMLNIR